MADEPLSGWLSLREAADAAARSTALLESLIAVLPARRPLRIVDLGTGTGSNVRYLAPRLPRPQQWLAVDRDARLLEELRHRVDVPIETRTTNLGTLVDGLFDGRDIVTASALLDLVSEAWLVRLAAQCRRVGAAALFALTYNGESRCDPPEPEDDEVRALMNRHQRQNDKGFGRAAGPDGTGAAEHAFVAAGYTVRRARSDWIIDASARELQRRLVEGWADAATAIAPGETDAIRAWLVRRLRHIDAGRSRIAVGHEDLAAWLR
ncbi:MAG TPA: class I SAM-dependent methyltransferase [Vicinamibacterales bacterium]|nr:class I SAM-dependent methyltransferase [Vicinamibacterales bacterium]